MYVLFPLPFPVVVSASVAGNCGATIADPIVGMLCSPLRRVPANTTAAVNASPVVFQRAGLVVRNVGRNNDGGVVWYTGWKHRPLRSAVGPLLGNAAGQSDGPEYLVFGHEAPWPLSKGSLGLVSHHT